MRASLLLLFGLNLAFVLFPVISPEYDPTGTNALFGDQIALYGKVLSSALTPLIVAATIAVGLARGRTAPLTAGMLFPSLLVGALMCVSAAVADTVRVETLAMAVFFLLFNLYLALMQEHPEGSSTLLAVFKAYFVVWMIAPLLAMLVDPSTATMFFVITPVDISYHGLTDSRVGFGLWISAFLLLLGKPRSRWGWLLAFVAVVLLLLSQSRAALFGLFLSGAYALLRDPVRRARALPRLVALLALIAVPLVSWSLFGRKDTFDVSEDRALIFSRFLDYAGQHWLTGYGGMYLIDLPEFNRIDVPAHNFVLQAIVNYGVATMLAFLAYFVGMFRALQATRARMLLIFLLVYGLYQPVQGTGNFFNPITLLFFLIIVAVDNVERHAPGAIATSTRGTRGGPQRLLAAASPR
jgi:O-antigen ligase